MKTSAISRRLFLTGISVAAAAPIVGKAASLPTTGKPAKTGNRRLRTSGKVLAAQWKVLAESKLAGQVPPGLARQIYRRLLVNA